MEENLMENYIFRNYIDRSFQGINHDANRS